MGKDQEFLEAARNGNVVIVEKLLNSKAKRGGPLASLRRGPGSNVQDSSGYSALHHAALNGHREIVVLLLEHEANPNITDSKGSTPLHLAAWAGHSDIVRLILTSGVRVTQINLRNKDNETALHCASQYGHTGVVSLLLKYGADPSFRNIRDETCLDLAAQYGRLEAVELLVQMHPQLIEAYNHQQQNATGVRLKTTPLHAASRNGHRAVVDVLLAAGFPVSTLTQTGTALHEASLCGKVDVVRRLLDAGIDVSLKDALGYSALRIVQDLPTPVAQDIAILIQGYALETDSGGDAGGSEAGAMPSRFPISSYFSVSSPYENVTPEGPNNGGGGSVFRVSSSSTTADSFITLPRRRHKISSTSSCHSQRSDESGSLYEVPPPPRSLPWLVKQKKRSNSSATVQDVQRQQQQPLSVSQSDLLDQDGGERDHRRETKQKHNLSRSFDARSLGFLSLSMSATSPVDDLDDDHVQQRHSSKSSSSVFSRSTRSRHSADQYLPMTGAPSNLMKVSPNPPQKPPRKLQGVSAHFESLPRSVGRQAKSRNTTDYTNFELLTTQQQQQNKNNNPPPPTGYEMVYLARTGSPQGASTGLSVSPRFRIQTTEQYVDMERQPSSYENVVAPARTSQSANVDEDSTYDIPRELGGPKTYENVIFNRSPTPPPPPSTSRSGSTSTSCSSSRSSAKSTPDSPSCLTHLPPTPDHPPPTAHMAEQSIHQRMRPLSEELKRKSRDMETETEEDIFLALNNSTSNGADDCYNAATNSSVSSDQSLSSTDHIEELLLVGDQPFEGLMRGSVPCSVSPIQAMAAQRPNCLDTTKQQHQKQPRWMEETHDSGSNGNGSSDRQSRSSLSVLSPFDEQEEWIKILEILNSCNSGLASENGAVGSGDSDLLDDVQRELQNRLDAAMGSSSVTGDLRSGVERDVIEVPVVSQDNISDWLLSLGLQRYLGLLMANGFDDVDFLGDGIVDDASLMEIGILDSEHRSRLVEGALLLSTPLDKMDRPSTVEEWLDLLRLGHYAEQFRKNLFEDMERVRRVWEVELTTLVEIRLVGHLRRMLVSLDESKRRSRPTPRLPPSADAAKASNNNNNNKQITTLTSDLQIISTGIAELEDASQKMQATDKGVKKKPIPPPRQHLPPTTAATAAATTVKTSSSYQSLERALESLSIRNPSELVIGIAKSVATQWRHKPQMLLRPGICYEAQYLGSTLVRHVRGTESTKRSIQKLKKRNANEASKCASIVLAISLSGVHFLDPFSQEAICKHEIRNINWACQDADDLTHFAYITKDQHDSTQDHFCHVFRVPTMDLATEVILTLGQAFEVAYQLVLHEDMAASLSPLHSSSPLITSQHKTVTNNIIPLQQQQQQQQTSTPAEAAAAAAPPANAKPSEPVRKVIGPKPTVLPPKPKLGTALLNKRPPPGAVGITHARSHSSVDRVLSTSTNKTSAMAETRLQSESNLASLQASVANGAILPMSSSVASISSRSSNESARAPLAAKDEL